MNYVRLFQVMSSYWSHELTNSAGAIDNVSQILASENGGLREGAADLLDTASNEIFTKLRFYQIASGVNGNFKPMNTRDISKLSAQYLDMDQMNSDAESDNSDYIHPKLLKIAVCEVDLLKKLCTEIEHLKFHHSKTQDQESLSFVATCGSVQSDNKKFGALLESIGYGNQRINFNNCREYYLTVMAKYFVIKMQYDIGSETVMFKNTMDVGKASSQKPICA